MRLTTRTKIQLASWLARAVLFLRSLGGRSPEGVFSRKGLKWNLDLREGIDFAIYLFGGFELSTRRAYGTLVGSEDVVLDIGANIGAHTLPLAALVHPAGKVYAFEATEYAVAKLRRNLELNKALGNVVEVHHCLLTDGHQALDTDAIHSSWPLFSGNGEGHPQHGGHLKKVGTTRQFSVDQFATERGLTRIDFVKLDVDGFEWPILQGAVGIVDQFHPAFIMELAPDYEGVSLEQILQFFWDRDYDFFDLERGHRISRDADKIRKSIPGGGSINVSAFWNGGPSTKSDSA